MWGIYILLFWKRCRHWCSVKLYSSYLLLPSNSETFKSLNCPICKVGIISTSDVHCGNVCGIQFHPIDSFSFPLLGKDFLHSIYGSFFPKYYIGLLIQKTFIGHLLCALQGIQKQIEPQYSQFYNNFPTYLISVRE